MIYPPKKADDFVKQSSIYNDKKLMEQYGINMMATERGESPPVKLTGKGLDFIKDSAQKAQN